MTHRLLTALALLGIAACSATKATPPTSHEPGSTTPSENPTSTTSPTTDVTPQPPPGSAAEGNADFALSMLTAVGSTANLTNKDVFVSPYSLSYALAMAYTGARNGTATEMRNVLRFTASDADLPSAFGAISSALATRGQNTGASGSAGGPFQLHVASSVWGDRNIAWQPTYLDTLSKGYDAALEQVDYVNAMDAATSQINQWVDNETEHLIPDLIAPGSLESDTKMVLVNAVFFDASWGAAFAPSSGNLEFTTIDGSTASLPQMEQASLLPYGRGQGYEAVAIPFSDPQLELVAILPGEDFTAFEKGLTGAKMLSIISGMTDQLVDLRFPRFSLTGDYDLGAALQSLGMNSAFTKGADFSGMSSNPADIFHIAKVIQKTKVNITEKGTLAAAATAVEMSSGATSGSNAPPPVMIHLTADHPFIMAVVDKPTQTLLFLGHVVDPTPAPVTPGCTGSSSGCD